MTFDKSISIIKLPISVAKSTLEPLINRELANIKWENNLEVTQVSIDGEGQEIKLELDVKSIYDGKLRVSFVPVYDKSAQRMVLEDLKLELADTGILAKGLNWVMKGFAKQKIINSFQSQLDKKISALANDFINKELKIPVAEVLNLQLECHELDLLNIRFEDDRLLLDAQLSASLRLHSLLA